MPQLEIPAVMKRAAARQVAGDYIAPDPLPCLADETRIDPKPKPNEKCCRRSKFVYTINGKKEGRCELHPMNELPHLEMVVEKPKPSSS